MGLFDAWLDLVGNRLHLGLLFFAGRIGRSDRIETVDMRGIATDHRAAAQYVDSLVARASASKDLAVAEVRTAVALSDDQVSRLKAALTNSSGHEVNLKVVIDPTVIGGVIATVGDNVIDGSVRTRLDQLKSRL